MVHAQARRRTDLDLRDSPEARTVVLDERRQRRFPSLFGCSGQPPVRRSKSLTDTGLVI